MRFARAWRRRKEPSVDQLIENVAAEMRQHAEDIINSTLLSDQPLPPRDKVESAAKLVVTQMLEPAARAAISKGTPAAEVDAYVSVIAAHAQVAFQERWAALQVARVEQAAEAGNA